jgi:glycosyltransferase involved in cell wall biosynthesis
LKTPDISVIMLTYNRENLVSRAIESVLTQTFEDFEFIVVNNGSSDRSGAIADEYAKKDSRIHVIHRERGNIGSGRNAGLDVANGEYIAFIDDDDWCEPDYLEFLYNLAVENDVDVSICGTASKSFDEKLIMTPEEAIIALLWRKYYNVGFPTKLIKRDIFNRCRFSGTSRYDDIYLMPKILAKSQLVAYHGSSKYTAYRHENNNSAWTSNHSLINVDILSEYLKVYRDRTEWLCDLFPNSAIAWRYFEWSFQISMVEKIIKHNLSDCEAHLVDMKQKLAEHREEFVGCPHILDFERKWVEAYVGKDSNTNT